MARRAVAEAVGTAFLLAAVVGSGIMGERLAGGNIAIALLANTIATGAMLVALILSFGPISGAHFNPAITLAVWLRGRCGMFEVPGYIIAQIAGASVASMAVLFFKGHPELPPPAELKVWPSLLAEFNGTYALAYVILNVATSKNATGHSNYALAIGFTVTAMAYAFGGISGAAFNPAVATGITLMHLVRSADIWIFFVANFSGGALAALTFRFLNPDDHCPPVVHRA